MQEIIVGHLRKTFIVWIILILNLVRFSYFVLQIFKCYSHRIGRNDPDPPTEMEGLG